jgi:hypothetical protein
MNTVFAPDTMHHSIHPGHQAPIIYQAFMDIAAAFQFQVYVHHAKESIKGLSEEDRQAACAP